MMHRKILQKDTVAFFIFLLINFLFSIKYLFRYTEYFFEFSVLLLFLQIGIGYYGRNLIKKIRFLSVLNLILLCVFLVAGSVVLLQVPVETLQVDRWSVINSFWDTYFSGDYAYFAKAHTGNPPGPMPFYFILSLPFYLFGELGLFSLSGALLFYVLLKQTDISEDAVSMALLLLFTSTFYIWEILGRSNIFVNSILVLASMVYFHKKELTAKRLLLMAIFVGLLMSSRTVFVIPYSIVFLSAWRTKRINFKQLFFLGSVAFGVFGLTFLPFIIGHFQDFLEMNPFLVQSTFLIPFQYTVGFIVLAIVFGWFCKSKANTYFFSGLGLFISIAFYFIYHIIYDGFEESYFESGSDVSYFILCIPFLMYYFMINKKNNLKSFELH